MADAAALPPHYRLLSYERVDSAGAQAIRLARQGAEEGTLIVASEQSAGYGRLRQAWHSPAGNLYAALILQPDYPLSQAAQLSYVTMLSLRAALAGVLPPLAELRYRWPNDLLLNDRKIAICFMHAAPPAKQPADDYTPAWLVIGFALNIVSHPLNTDIAATDMITEGATDAGTADILTGFCRHFLVWINRWAEDGMPAIGKTWRQHATGLGEPVAVRLAQEELYSGLFRDIDKNGDLLLELSSQKQQRISLNKAYGLPETAA